MIKVFGLILICGVFLSACDKASEQSSSANTAVVTDSALSEEWVELGQQSSDAKSIDYYKPSSQKHIDGLEMVTMKTILVKDDEQRKLKVGDYLLGVIGVDCKNKQVGMFVLKVYDAHHTLKREFDMRDNVQMKSIIQGEPLDRMSTQICQKH